MIKAPEAPLVDRDRLGPAEYRRDGETHKVCVWPVRRRKIVEARHRQRQQGGAQDAERLRQRPPDQPGVVRQAADAGGTPAANRHCSTWTRVTAKRSWHWPLRAAAGSMADQATMYSWVERMRTT